MSPALFSFTVSHHFVGDHLSAATPALLQSAADIVATFSFPQVHPRQRAGCTAACQSQKQPFSAFELQSHRLRTFNPELKALDMFTLCMREPKKQYPQKKETLKARSSTAAKNTCNRVEHQFNAVASSPQPTRDVCVHTYMNVNTHVCAHTHFQNTSSAYKLKHQRQCFAISACLAAELPRKQTHT